MMIEKETNEFVVASNCPCNKFLSVDHITDALESEEQTRLLIEWLSTGPTEQEVYLSCQRPSQRNLQCTNRIKASFSVLEAIREHSRPFLVSSSAPSSNFSSSGTCDFPSTKSTTPGDVSYEVSFPSLSMTSIPTQVKPNVLVARKKSKKIIISTQPHQLVSNEGQKQQRRMKPTHTVPLNSASSNISMISSEDPIELRQKVPSSTWQGIGATKSESPRALVVTGTISPAHGLATSTSQNTTWVATANKTTTTLPCHQQFYPKPTTSSVMINKGVEELNVGGENNLRQNLDEVGKAEQRNRLARVYATLMHNLLVPSTVMEIHLLVRLLAVSDLKDASTTTFAKGTALKELLDSPMACRSFAISTLHHIRTKLCNLPLVLVMALVSCPPFKKYLPDVVSVLVDSSRKRREHIDLGGGESDLDLGGGANSTPMLSLPFNHQRDSRHNYKTKDESDLFKNREECRDTFLYQLRVFQNTRGKILDTSELQTSAQQIKMASKNFIQGIHSLNMNWFAEFFCELLLQIGLAPIDETDADLLSMTDKDKLQKLHKRFSSTAGSVQISGEKVNLNFNKSVSTLSPSIEAQHKFPGHQEFFFLFIQSTDSYSFGVHLKSRLAMLITGMTSSYTQKGISTKLLKLQLLARFLGFVVFSPNWGAGSALRVLSTDETTSWLTTTEPCLPFLEMIRSSWAHQQIITVIPWVVEYLYMAKWDKVSLHRSPSLNALLATLRAIHYKLKQKPESESSNSSYVSDVLEPLFGDVYGLGRTVYLQNVELPPLISDNLGNDAIDKSPLLLNDELVLTANPYLNELHSLTTNLAQEMKESTRASRKLRPSMVIASQSTVLRTDDEEIDSNNISTLVMASGVQSSITTKLVDAFFHQHRILKDTCEFVVGRAVKNAVCIALQCFITPHLERKLMVDVVVLLRHELEHLANQTAVASRGVARKVLEDTIRRSLDLLSPVGTSVAVKNMASSLCIAHGLKLMELMLVSSATIETEKMYDESLRQRRR